MDHLRSCSRQPTLRVLLELAARGHGWFLSRDAAALGVAPTTLSRLRSAGVIESPKHGLNRLVDFPDSWEGRATAALWGAGGAAALSRWAAVRVIEGKRSSPEIDLVIPRQRNVGRGLTSVRTHVRLADADVIEIAGFRVTCPAFTICDLAARSGPKRLLDLADRWVAEDRVSLEALHAMVGRFRAIEGVERLRDILSELSPASRWTRSDGERAWRRCVHAAGLPEPVANHRVIDADGVRRYLDFAYPELKIGIEIDLHPSHSRTVGRSADGRRQNALVLVGWTILRFDLVDLMLRPDHVVETLTRAIAAASA